MTANNELSRVTWCRPQPHGATGGVRGVRPHEAADFDQPPSPGDLVMLTAAVRDLHGACLGQFRIGRMQLEQRKF